MYVHSWQQGGRGSGLKTEGEGLNIALTLFSLATFKRVHTVVGVAKTLHYIPYCLTTGNTVLHISWYGDFQLSVY